MQKENVEKKKNKSDSNRCLIRKRENHKKERIKKRGRERESQTDRRVLRETGKDKQ